MIKRCFIQQNKPEHWVKDVDHCMVLKRTDLEPFRSVKSILTRAPESVYSEYLTRRSLMKPYMNPIKKALQPLNGLVPYKTNQCIDAMTKFFIHNKVDEIIIKAGSHWFEKAAVYCAKQLGLSIVFLEFGALPNTVQVDRIGVNVKNSLINNPAFYQQHQFRFDEKKSQLTKRKSIKKVSIDSVELPKQYIFVPFQVCWDSQITEHSEQIQSMQALYDWVLRMMPALTKLGLQVVIKEHPSCKASYPHLMDNHPNIHFANGNNTQQLIDNSQCVLTINSSVGLEAILRNKPCITLGNAFYNLPGLVFNCLTQEQAIKAVNEISNNWQYPAQLRKNYLGFLQYYLFNGSMSDADFGKKLMDHLALIDCLYNNKLLTTPAGFKSSPQADSSAA